MGRLRKRLWHWLHGHGRPCPETHLYTTCTCHCTSSSSSSDEDHHCHPLPFHCHPLHPCGHCHVCVPLLDITPPFLPAPMFLSVTPTGPDSVTLRLSHPILNEVALNISVQPSSSSVVFERTATDVIEVRGLPPTTSSYTFFAYARLLRARALRSITSRSAPVTLLSSPRKPSIVSFMQVGSSQLEITFSSPPQLGAVYIVTVEPLGLTFTLSDANATTLLIDGLSANSSYTLSAVEVIQGTRSSPSDPINVRIQQVVPPPSIFSVSLAADEPTAIDVRFQTRPPAQQSYTARTEPDGLSITTTSSDTVRIRNAIRGQTYKVVAYAWMGQQRSVDVPFATEVYVPMLPPTIQNAYLTPGMSRSIDIVFASPPISNATYEISTETGPAISVAVVRAGQTVISVGGLIPGEIYTFRATAKNAKERTATSNVSSSIQVPVDPPTITMSALSDETSIAPLNRLARVPNAVRLTFDTPPINGAVYSILSSPPITQTILVAEGQSTVTIPNVPIGREYWFYAVTTRKGLTSRKSNMTGPFLIRPPQPVIQSVSAENGIPNAASVSFALPAPSDSVYLVKAEPGGLQATVPSNQNTAIVSGLSSTIAYSFQAVTAYATNLSVVSDPSTEVSYTPPEPQLPSPIISSVVLSPVDSSAVNITFDSPVPAGQVFLVYSQPDAISTTVTAGNFLATISGLVSGQSYRFYAVALGEEDPNKMSLASELSSVITLTLNGPIVKSTKAIDSNTLQIQFLNPPPEGVSYNAVVLNGPTTNSATLPVGSINNDTIVLTGMQADSLYTIRTFAANQSLTATADGTIFNFQMPPNPPSIVSVYSSNQNGMYVIFGAIERTDGLQYKISVEPPDISPVIVSASQTSAFLTGLIPGQSYTIRAVLVRDNIESLSSEPFGPVQFTIPAPVITSVTIDPNQSQYALVRVSSPIPSGTTMEVVTIPSSGVVFQFANPNATSFSVGPLLPGQKYSFQASYRVGGYRSAESNVSDPITLPLSTPTIQSATAEAFQATIQLLNGPSPQSVTRVVSIPSGIEVIVQPGSTTAVFFNLMPATTYQFYAINESTFTTSNQSLLSNSITTAPAAPVLQSVVIVGSSKTDADVTFQTTAPPNIVFDVYTEPPLNGSPFRLQTNARVVKLVNMQQAIVYSVYAVATLLQPITLTSTRSNTIRVSTGLYIPVIRSITANGTDANSALITFEEAPANGFRYIVRSSPGEQVQTTTSNTLLFTGLSQNTTYTFTTYSTDNTQNSVISDPSTPFTTPPSAPVIEQAILAVDGMPYAADVSVVMPPPAGVTYTITSTPDNLTQTLTSGMKTVRFRNLKPLTSYTFRAVASTAQYTSTSSPPSPPLLIPLSAPVIDRAILSPTITNAVDVYFTQPVPQGISFLIRTQDQSAAVVTVTQGNAMGTVTGLVSGRQYTFTAVAVLSGQTTPTSNVSNEVGPITITLPPPMIVSVTANSPSSLLVVFSGPPLATGYSYVVTTNTNETFTTTTDRVLVTGLTPGKIYTVTAYQFNSQANAQSASTGPSEAVITPLPPPVIRTTTVNITNVQVEIEEYVGDNVTIELYSSPPSNIQTIKNSNTATFSNLTPGTTYLFFAKAKNPNTESNPSNPSNAVTIPVPAPTIQSVQLTSPTSKDVVVTFNQPIPFGYTYTVTSTPENTTVTANQNDTTVTFRTLQYNTTYTFQAYATVNNVNSPLSAPSQSVTTAPAPPLIQKVEVNTQAAKYNSATVTFVQPPEINTLFYIQVTPPDVSDVMVSAGTSKVNIDGLTNGKAYTFQAYTLAANNNRSDLSARSTPLLLPPFISNIQADPNTLLVEFDSIEPNTNYLLYLSPADVPVQVLASPELSISIRNLKQGQTYNVAAVAQSNALTSISSVVRSASIPIATPVIVEATNTGNNPDTDVSVKLQVPAPTGITYEVLSSPDGKIVTLSAGEDTAIFKGLRIGETYTFQATAKRGELQTSPSSNISNSITIPFYAPVIARAYASPTQLSSVIVEFMFPVPAGVTFVITSDPPDTPAVTITEGQTQATIPNLNAGFTYIFFAYAEIEPTKRTNTVQSEPVLVALPAPLFDTVEVVNGTDVKATFLFPPIDEETVFVVSTNPPVANSPFLLTTKEIIIQGFARGYKYTLMAFTKRGDKQTASVLSRAITIPLLTPNIVTVELASTQPAPYATTANVNVLFGEPPPQGARYVVASQPSSTNVLTNGTVANFLNLPVGRQYTFTAYAVSENTQSETTNPTNPFVLPVQPPVIASVTLHPTDPTRLQVNFETEPTNGATFTAVSSTNNQMTIAAGTTAIVSGLQTNKSYTFTAYATFNGVVSQTVGPTQPVLTLPETPTIQSVAEGNTKDSILITMTSPPPTGVTYTLTASPSNTSISTNTNTATFSNLMPGVGYTFTATAQNASGTSTPTNPTALFVVPPKITAVQPVISNNGSSAFVTIQPGPQQSYIFTLTTTPADASPITIDYDAEKVSGVTVQVPNLKFATNYTFTATSTETTTNTSSATSDEQTIKIDVPTPKFVSVQVAQQTTPTTANIVFSSTPPAGYTYQVTSSPPTTTQTVPAGSNTIDFTGLALNETYTFFAKTVMGATQSTTETSMQVSTPPAVPEITTVTSNTTNTITINFRTAPATGTFFQIKEKDTGNIVASVPSGATTTAITNLAYGQTYSFVAQARNTNKNTASANTQPTQPIVLTPNIQSVVAGTTQDAAVVTFTPPPNSNHFFTLNVSPQDAQPQTIPYNVNNTTTTTAIVTGLQPGVVYTFTATSTNTTLTLTSAASAPFSYTTRLPEPIIQNVVAVAGTPTSANVTFNNPPVTGATFSVTTPSIATPFTTTTNTITLTGLALNTTYTFTAITIKGTQQSTQTTFNYTTPPATVTINSIAASGQTSILVTFNTAPPAGVTYLLTSNYGVTYEANTATYNVTGLQQGRGYFFAVTAKNTAANVTSASSANSATVYLPPLLQTVQQVVAGTNYAANITIERPPAVTGDTYILTTNSADATAAPLPPNSTIAFNASHSTPYVVNVTGLQAGVTYTFTATAGTSTNRSANATSLTTTFALPRPNITNVTAVAGTPTSAIVEVATPPPTNTTFRVTAPPVATNFSIATGATNTTITGLALDTNYTVTAVAIRGAATGTDTGTFAYRTPIATPVFSSYTTQANQTSVLIAFTAAPATGNKYVLTPTPLDAGMAIIEVPAGSTSVVATNLQNGKGYTWSVQAVKVDNSNTSQRITTPLYIAPPAITNPQLITTGGNAFQANLTINQAPTTGYSYRIITTPTDATVGTFADTIINSVGGVTSTSATINNIIVGTTYTFTATATNGTTTSTTSTPITLVVPVPKPVFASLSLTSLNSISVPFTFAPPLQTTYTVTSTPASSTQTVAAGSSAPASFTGLAFNTSYTFSAVAKRGTTATATSDPSQTILTGPATPNITAVAQGAPNTPAGTTSASVTFSVAPPAGVTYNITHTATTGTTGTSTHSSGTTATVTGLTPGLAYTFTATASNAAGTSPTSNTSALLTTAPILNSATIQGDPSTSYSAIIQLSNKPQATGYSYRITTTPADGTVGTFPDILINYSAAAINNTPVEATVNNLIVGTTYTFTAVTLLTLSGTNYTSAQSLAATQNIPVPTPSFGTITVARNAITIPFTYPPPPQTTYTVKNNVTAATVNINTGSTTPASFTGLLFNTNYTFDVTAKRGTVTGTTRTSQTILTGPTTPVISSVAQGTTNTTNQTTAVLVNLTVAPPTGVTYNIIYTTTTGETGTVTHTTGTQANVTGLKTGQGYTFKATATNATETSPDSNTSSLIVTQPFISTTQTSGTETTSTATLTFNQPPSQLHTYNVSTSPADATPQTLSFISGATSATANFTTLKAGVLYTFTATSRYNGTTTSASTTSTGITPLPTPIFQSITNESASNTNVLLTFQFAPPAGTTFAITSTPTTTTQTLAAGATTLSFTGLAYSTSYTFTAVCKSTSFTGTFVTSTSITTNSLPSPSFQSVTAVSGTPTSAIVTFTGTPPSGGSYRVTTTPTTNTFNTTTSTVTLTGLSLPDTNYTLSAVTIVGAMTSSPPSTFVYLTPLATPVFNRYTTQTNLTSVNIAFTVAPATGSKFILTPSPQDAGMTILEIAAGSTSVNATNLINGKTYTWSVQAVKLDNSNSSQSITTPAYTTPNKLVTQQFGNKLVGTGFVGSSSQGRSVSLSGDGTTLAIGGSTDNTFVGATWIFTKNASSFVQQGAKLVGTGASNSAARQGTSVSLSTDGNTLAVGGPNDNATWVFTRTNNVWSQQGAKLVGGNIVGSPSQGTSVSLSSDGNVLAIGGGGDNAGRGATWIFKRFTGTWVDFGKLVGSGVVNQSQQGFSVALSGDGKTLAVGGNNDNNFKGAVWIFFESGGTGFMQQGTKLFGSGTSSNNGKSVSLSSDGNTLAFGGEDGSGLGATWVFTRTNGVWTEQAKLKATNGDTSQGRSVSLSSNGNSLAIGANTGTYIFTRSNTTWTQQNGQLIGTGSTGQAFQGASVSLASDAGTLAVGGPSDDFNNGTQLGVGATWVFV